MNWGRVPATIAPDPVQGLAAAVPLHIKLNGEIKNPWALATVPFLDEFLCFFGV